MQKTKKEKKSWQWNFKNNNFSNLSYYIPSFTYSWPIQGTVGQKTKQKENTVNSNTNFRRKMKPITINVIIVYLIWCFNYFSGVCLHGGGCLYLTSNFFKVSPKIWQQNRKVHLSDSLDTNFYIISNISTRILSNAKFYEESFFS